MPVRFHAVFIFREAVVRIRDNEPQNVPSSFADLLEAYAAVFIYAGNHITVMEGLPALYPHTHCVQKIADMLLGEVYDRLEIQMLVFLHSMRVCIAQIRIRAGIIKNTVYDPVNIFSHNALLRRQHIQKFLLSQDFDAELLCLCQFAFGFFPADQVIRLFGNGAAGRGAEADDLGVDPVAGEVLKFSCRCDGASCKCVVLFNGCFYFSGNSILPRK